MSISNIAAGHNPCLAHHELYTPMALWDSRAIAVWNLNLYINSCYFNLLVLLTLKKKQSPKGKELIDFLPKQPRCPAAAADISADLNIVTYNVWSQPSSFHGRLHQLQGLLPGPSSTDTCTHCCGHCHHVTSQSWPVKL